MSTVDSESRIASLGLILPTSVSNASSADMGQRHLAGYEQLMQLREQTAKFRAGYRNWRKGARAGAKGEVKNLVNQAHQAAAAVEQRKRLSTAGVEEAKADEEDGQVDWLRFLHNPHQDVAKHDPLKLCDENLAQLREWKGGAKFPIEGSRTASNFIAHIGVGGFHRSHQAYVLDQVMQESFEGPDASSEERWGVIGIGLMPWDRRMYDTLKEQDYYYTLLMRSRHGSDAVVVSAIHDFLFIPDDAEASIARLCDESVRIISLTVTEKGYYRDVKGDLDVENANVASDIAEWTEDGIACPKTSFGLICTVQLLRRRAGTPLATIMSCDNLPMNGNTCRKATLQFAAAVDEEMHEWMRHEAAFPNSMVDRITPGTEPQHIELIKTEFGVEDGWPVVAEPFLQWVIEDHFTCGRPPWEAFSGVLFTERVVPYELMKLRLLNSSHSALSHLSYLAGHRFVDDAMADTDVSSFLRVYMGEVVTTVPEVEGINLDEYQKTLQERFGNPYIKDKVKRLCQDGSQKFQNTLQEALVTCKDHDLSAPPMIALAIAGYLRYMAAVDEQGEAIVLEDPLEDTLRPIAEAALGGERGPVDDFVLALFGEEIHCWDEFCAAVHESLQELIASGAKAVLRARREEVLHALQAEIEELRKLLTHKVLEQATLMPKEERVASLRLFM